MTQIIQDNEIDEEAAKSFLNDCYNGVNLLPNVPGIITRQIAASVLNVSMSTIERMLQDKQIQLTRKSLQEYIFGNMLVNRPLDWDDEEQMNAKAREMTPEELAEHKKVFSDMEESISALYGPEPKPIEGGLFSEEDLKQE